MHIRLSSIVLCSLASLGMTQNHVVSPPQYAKYEASAASDIPFAGLSRYQQIHGELKGTARTLLGIAWRRDGLFATNSMPGRNLDMELLCCNSSLASASATFATNYLGSPTTVVTRKTIVSPDFSQIPDDTPAPWKFNLVFDAPFAYAGASDLLYEVRIHGLSSGALYACDAASARDSSITGPLNSVGLGCLTANGTMRLRATFTTNTGANTLSLGWAISNGPTAATAGLLIGLTNPNAYLPNLCNGNYLYTDGAVVGLIGATDALGRWTLPTSTIAWNPAFAGAALTAQAAAVDIGQGGLNVAASNGIRNEVAPGPQAFQITRVYAGTATATTGQVNVGYGLVTRFQY